MSTLMSKDLNIVRPSTRLHAPPGGKSSISFGGEDDSRSKSQTNFSKPVSSSATATPLSENVNPQKESNSSSAPIRRVRQAPGGSSSIVIG